MAKQRTRSFEWLHRARDLVVLATMLLWISTAASAQTSGTVSGVVSDPNGAPLPGVTVTARSPELQRESSSTTTDADGSYRLTPLPAGTYSLTFSLDGFATQSLEGIRVGVNARVTADWAMQLEALEESVQVTSEVPLMEVTRSEAVTRVDLESIENLPLKTRNPEDLVSLVPGVTPRPQAAGQAQFSIFGERPSATGYVYDGADNYDPQAGGSLQRYAQDSIQEFEVITTGYEAEWGRAQGGVVNVVTRSGTNDLQARAFYYVRDDSWDSSNVSGQDAPQLSRDQFGLAVGGKIQRDRLFYFAAGEALDESRGRNIDRSTVPGWVQDGLATVQGNEDFNQGPTVDGLTLLGKLDFLPGESQRWTFAINNTDDDAAGEIPAATVAGTLLLPSAATTQTGESLSGTLNQSTVFGRHGVLDSSLRYVDAQSVGNADRSGRGEAVLLLFRSGFIQTSASSPANAGRTERDTTRLAARQSYSMFRGSHDLKFGWEVIDTQLKGFDTVSNDVEYSAAFLYPNQSEVNEALFREFGFEQSAARFMFLSPDPSGALNLNIDNTDLAFYGQDKWQVGDNVTLNLGLRYDRASLFGDDDDNFSPRLGVVWDVGGRHETLVSASAGLFYDQNALAAAAGVPAKGGIFRISAFDVVLPRLGATYSDSLIDLVITSGFPGGSPENPLYRQFAEDLAANPLLLYDMFGIDVGGGTPPLVNADNIQALSGLTPDEALALLEATYPGTDWTFFDLPGGSIVGDRVLSFLPRGPLDAGRTVQSYSADKVPVTEGYTLGIEHQFLPSFKAGLTYVKRSTEDVLTSRVINLYDVAPGDPNFGKTTDGGPLNTAITYDGVIDYEGITLSLIRPFRGWWGGTFSYTYSSNEDNLLTGNVGSGFSNNNNPGLDYGMSNLSVPNVAVASFTTRLPLDFRISGIAFYRDGPAFSPRGITDSDGDGLVDQRDLSVPRNSVRVDDIFSFDMRVEKGFRLPRGHEITLMVEGFNLTNEANVVGVNTVSGPNFGIPNSFLPGREIQLGVRYFFGAR